MKLFIIFSFLCTACSGAKEQASKELAQSNGNTSNVSVNAAQNGRIVHNLSQARSLLLDGTNTYDIQYNSNELIVSLNDAENDVYRAVVTHQASDSDIHSSIVYIGKTDLLEDNVALCGPAFCFHIASLKLFDKTSGLELLGTDENSMTINSNFTENSDTRPITAVHFKKKKATIEGDISENAFFKTTDDNGNLYFIGLKGPLVQTCSLSPTGAVTSLDTSYQSNSTYDTDGIFKSIFFFSNSMKDYLGDSMSVLNIEDKKITKPDGGTVDLEKLTDLSNADLAKCTSFWNTVNNDGFYNSTQLYTLQNQFLMNRAGTKLADANAVLPQKLIPFEGKNKFIDFVSKNAYSDLSLQTYLTSSAITQQVVFLQAFIPDIASQVKEAADQLGIAQTNANILASTASVFGKQSNSLVAALKNANANATSATAISTLPADLLKKELDLQSLLADTYAQSLVAEKSYGDLESIPAEAKKAFDYVFDSITSVLEFIGGLKNDIRLDPIKDTIGDTMAPIQKQLGAYLGISTAYYTNLPSAAVISNLDNRSEFPPILTSIETLYSTAKSSLKARYLPVVGAGDKFTCALVFPAATPPTPLASQLFCWGEGQVGLGNTVATPHIPTVLVVPSSLISTGAADNMVVGDSFLCVSASSSPKTACLGSIVKDKASSTAGWKSMDSVYTGMVAGDKTACGLNTDGDVYCWGDTSFLPNHDNSDDTFALPLEISVLKNARKLALGANFLCGILENFTVKCVGQDEYGQLGGASTLSGVMDISAKNHTVCAATVTKTYCWGQANKVTNTVFNAAYEANSKGKRVDVGVNYYCNRDDIPSYNGAPRQAYCNKIDYSNKLNQNKLIQNFDSPIYSIAIGKGDNTNLGHFCGVLLDGSIWCWGDNNAGQLGNNSTTSSANPIKILAPFNSSATDYCSNTAYNSASWSANACGY